jgi:hypothetical protein
MEPDPKRKELTPEERLFKIIQEAEKSGKDDTLVASPDKEATSASASAVPARDPREGFYDRFLAGANEHDVNVKKARRALLLAAGGAASRLSRLATLQTLNRALAGALTVAVLYLAISQITQESASAQFLRKAEGLGMPPLELPADLASGGAAGDFAELAERDLFHPWKAEPPPAAAPQAGVAVPAPASFSQLKLSGIYLGEVPEALVEAVDEKKTYTVAAGSVVKGLTVKEVRADGVVLSDGRAEHVLQ